MTTFDSQFFKSTCTQKLADVFFINLYSNKYIPLKGMVLSWSYIVEKMFEILKIAEIYTTYNCDNATLALPDRSLVSDLLSFSFQDKHVLSKGKFGTVNNS